MLNVKAVPWWPMAVIPPLLKQGAGLSHERLKLALHREFQARHYYIARLCLKAGKQRRGDGTGGAGEGGGDLSRIMAKQLSHLYTERSQRCYLEDLRGLGT